MGTTSELTSSIDPILDAALTLVNRSEYLTCQVSFTFNGFHIEGKLISEKQYLANWNKAIQDVDACSFAGKAVSGQQHIKIDERDEIEEWVSQYRSNCQQIYEEQTRAADPHSKYLHLRQAKVLAPNGETCPTDFWRGKVTHVDSILHIGLVTTVARNE